MKPELQSELDKRHSQIAKTLGLQIELLQFHYSTEEGLTTLKLATRNPRHLQTFLFHTTTGFGELDALSKMEEYINENKSGKSTYTIQWALDGETQLHTSYFTGKNMYEVLDKFYYNKAITGTTIFSISLNPLS